MANVNFWDNWDYLETGTPKTLSYRRLFVNAEGREVSLWSDVPLYAEQNLLHSVCKSPKGTCSAYHVEVTEDTPGLKLALNKGKMCSYVNPPLWNIGMLPQTWADPSQPNADQFEGLLNDGQPIEVIEISDSPSEVGQVSVLKPLTAFLVTNTIHITLHIVGIDVKDPISAKLNNKNDIQNYFPDAIGSIRDWLQNCYGKEGRMVLPGEASKELSLEDIFSLISKAHSSWKVFSEVQSEWKQRSAEVLNYGMVMWEHYTVHDSEARIPRTKKSLDSNRLYAMAWASSKDNDVNPCERDESKKEKKRDPKRRPRRGDLISYMVRETNAPKVSHSEVTNDKKRGIVKRFECGCFPLGIFSVFKSPKLC